MKKRIFLAIMLGLSLTRMSSPAQAYFSSSPGFAAAQILLSDSILQQLNKVKPINEGPGPTGPKTQTVLNLEDINGDGKEDLLVRHTSSGEVNALLMAGTTFSQISLASISPDWSIVGFGDLDGNGQADLLVRHTSSGQVNALLMAGTTFSEAVVFSEVPPQWIFVGAKDFDGDGKSDLLWRNSCQDGTVEIWLMDGARIRESADYKVSLEWNIVPGPIPNPLDCPAG